jgi:hypothetical protein
MTDRASKVFRYWRKGDLMSASEGLILKFPLERVLCRLDDVLSLGSTVSERAKSDVAARAVPYATTAFEGSNPD